MKINTLFHSEFHSDASLPLNLDAARNHSTYSIPFLSKFQQAFTQWFASLAQTPEPQVTFKRHRTGEHYWEVYDPTSNRSMIFFTAKEVRTWLEQRYYQ